MARFRAPKGVTDAVTEVGTAVATGPAARAATAVPPGAYIAGYEIGEQLGRGGMGVVYRAHHVTLDRPAAVKVLAPELAENAEFRERFIRESQMAGALRHPSVVTVYDAGDHGGLLYLAMQLVEGTDLRRRLDDVGALSPEETVVILFQVAEALEAAHAIGLVHRDVKPANVLLDGSHAYLGDFGLSKRLAAGGGLTAAGEMLGTVDYVAPEQIEGRDVNPRTDVYALGCVAYECLTGAPPFDKATSLAVLFAHVSEEPKPLSDARPGIPRRADLPMAQAMAKAPERRYARPTEFILDLTAELGVQLRDARASRARARVAVASSDPTIFALVRGSLAALPVEVDEVRGGQIPDDGRPPVDVLVVDATVGEDATRRLVEAVAAHSSSGERPRVLALIRRGASARELAPLREIADGFLGKPFSGLQLASRLRPLIGEDVLGD
jgi:Protein kinase domain